MKLSLPPNDPPKSTYISDIPVGTVFYGIPLIADGKIALDGGYYLMCVSGVLNLATYYFYSTKSTENALDRVVRVRGYTIYEASTLVIAHST